MVKNISNKPEPEELTEESIRKSLKKEEILKDKIMAGEWESLSLVEAFWERSPDGQLLAIREAINNRCDQLRKVLPSLLNDQRHRDAYIQILDYIHELERRRDDFTAEFFQNLGRRKIEVNNKDKRYY